MRIAIVLAFERLDQRRFIAAVSHALCIGLRVVPHVAGADPVEENAVDRIVVEQFLQDRQLVRPHLRIREAELRLVCATIAMLPAKLRVLLGELALQPPAMIVLVDRNPRVNLQPDPVAIFDGGGEAVEMGVVKRIELAVDLLPPRRREAGGEALCQRLILIALRVPKAVIIPFALRPHQRALVERAATVEGAPVNARPSAGLAGIEHVAHAFDAPGDVGFERPIRMRQRRAQDQLIICRR